jgi:hypothetical protein
VVRKLRDRTNERAAELAHRIAEQAVLVTPGPEVGLTTRTLRIWTAQHGLLSEARRQLVEELHGWAFPGVDIRRERARALGDDAFLAELSVKYEAIRAQGGRGARKRLAASLGLTDKAVSNLLERAKAEGYWQTMGRGRPGQATALARQVFSTTKGQP